MFVPLATSACGSDTKLAVTTTAAAVTTTVPAVIANSDPATSTTAAPTTQAPTTVAASAAATAPTASTAPTAAPIDGGALLQAALAKVGPGYHFTTTVTVDGAVILTADGDRVGTGSRLTVTQNAASIKYVITADGTWVQPDGGDWQKLDTPAATSDPITALGAPTGVTVASNHGATMNLTVTVPSASLGLTGDPVALTVSLSGDALSGVLYQTTVNSKPATVQAKVGAVVDSTPVVAPI